MPNEHEARLSRLESEVEVGRDRLAEPQRLAQQIDETSKRISSMFKKTVRQSRPTRDLVVSDDRRVQKAWEQRYDRMKSDVAELNKALGYTQKEVAPENWTTT